jgi:cation transport ATPase
MMGLGQKIDRTRWWLLGAIVLMQIIILLLAPEEKTIGNGIKPVYLHVSLTWTGMALFFITALLGLEMLFSKSGTLESWHRICFTAALLFFGSGLLVSLYASYVNWGGIPLQEPKFRMAVNVIVAGFAGWYLRELAKPRAIKALSSLIPVGFMFLGSSGPRMVLHPENPVMTSPLGIKGSFLAMFALAVLLAAWFLWYRRPDRRRRQDA